MRFRRDITGLLWLSIGIFLGLSLISYNSADPSFNSTGEGSSVLNYCGYFGSFLADGLYQLFGLTAWVVVLACFRAAYYRFTGTTMVPTRSRVIGSILLCVSVASLCALYWPEFRVFDSQISLGGFVGSIVSQSLLPVFNFVGVAVILWTIVAVLMVIYTERSLVELALAPVYLVGKAKPLTSRVPSIDWRGYLDRFFGFFRIEESAEESQKFISIKEEDHLEVEEDVAPQPSSPPKAIFTLSPVKKGQKRRVTLKKKVQRRIANWELPKISLLEDPPATRSRVDEKEIRAKAKTLVNKLEQFNVRGEVVGFSTGPAVTLFEFKPKADVKISKITELADDLSLALSSESVRIIAPIPGRDVVGIETSNSVRETVYLKDTIADEQFWSDEIALPVALGQQADGQPKIVDLRKMPHLMVAGSTGSGKSVFTVSMITGLLFNHSPKTLRLILVDPKQVDLAAFSEIPHLLMPPVREAKKAIGALKWAIKEMEKRYRSMSKFGARGIESFNEIVEELGKSEIEEYEQENEELRPGESFYFTPQPFIVIVVEEFGDLMAVDKSNVEQAVVRLAQMARACGIHLVLAMQSPRKDVVTGLIKTNIPGRIAFKVASKMDSRIVLDESGAERLLTRGDMLYLAPGVSKPVRHHGPWLTEKEIATLTQYWRDQGEPEYDELAMRALDGSGGGYELGAVDDGDDDSEFDEKYDEILAWVSTIKEVSASLLQRRFRLGYPRAARLIEIFESQGVVGPANGSKPRQVLVNELK